MERIFFCGDCQKFFFEDCEESVYFCKCKHCGSEHTIACNLTKEVYDTYGDDKKNAFKQNIKSKFPTPQSIMLERKRITEERERAIIERKRAEARREQEKAERARKIEQINNLKKNGYEGYYEYKTIRVRDDYDGSVTTYEISNLLNEHALDGWRLVTSYANELGHNSSSSYGTGTNATIDEHILIMERFVKL